jgi:hypothetical protein
MTRRGGYKSRPRMGWEVALLLEMSEMNGTAGDHEGPPTLVPTMVMGFASRDANWVIVMVTHGERHLSISQKLHWFTQKKDLSMPEKKRVLILQHIHENPSGRVDAILDEYETFYHLIHVGKVHLPGPTSYKAFIVLGGAAHLYDKNRYPYTVLEEAYLSSGCGRLKNRMVFVIPFSSKKIQCHKPNFTL